jgi:deoxyhypusine synthase
VAGAESRPGQVLSDTVSGTMEEGAGKMWKREELLQTPIRHIDFTQHNVVPWVEAMRDMAFSARDLARAADICERMTRDPDCGIILCLAGSLISAGLKKVFADAVRFHMVDAIVSTGANIVDQDFFEALGFHHYVGDERLRSGMFDAQLRELRIDRIYDTLLDEDQLRICDDTIRQIADSLEPRPYSSREFIRAMGEYLHQHGCKSDCSIVYEAYRHDVPIFVPAFSDCSAGFGLVAHQHARQDAAKVTLDSAKDFYELTLLKIHNPTTGLFMVGGGVPKNFAQDVVVAADVLGHEVPMHKYAVQVTVADVRDGALSSSTLKEACSWGKVDLAFEQMVYAEATLAVPLLLGYVYHKGAWKGRTPRRWSKKLEQLVPTTVA